MSLLNNFIGNRHVIEELSVELEAVRRRGTRLDHILITGPSGTGKTTLGSGIAAELRIRFLNMNSPQVNSFEKQVLAKLAYFQRSGDLTFYAQPTIIFFDEAHELDKKLQMLLLKVLLEGTYELSDGRTIDLSYCTFVFATTNAEGLFGPLKQRCQLRFHLEKYSVDDLATILQTFEIEDGGYKYSVNPHPDLCRFIAKRARHTPRIALDYMRRVYNHARSRSTDVHTSLNMMQQAFSTMIAERFFKMRQIDENGLTLLDMKYLSLLGQLVRPIGVSNIAAQLEIDEKEIKEEIEPYLRSLQLIDFMPKGRLLSVKGRNLLNSRNSENQEAQNIVLTL